MANRIPLDSLCQPKVATLPNDFDDVIDYIDISSVDNESKTIIAHQEVDAKDAPSRARQLLQVGDVIVSTVRPNLNAVALVESAYENTLVGSTGYCVLRVKDGVDNRFVFYFCQSPYFVEDMTTQATGASYPAVTASIVRNSTLPAYSLEEQHEIAQHLDTVTNLISLRKQQIAKLDELVKARFVEMFGDQGYPYQDLITLISDGAGLSYGIVQPGDDGTGDMGVLRPVDIVDGHIVTESIKYIDRTIGDGFRKTELTGDELLITVRGTTGITALTDGRFSGMNVTRGIAVIRFDRIKINPNYLNAYLQCDESQSYIQEHTRGATLKQINLSDLRIQPILVPPRSLQDQFAAFVAQTDQQKLTIQHSLAQLELLKKALMQKYFG